MDTELFRLTAREAVALLEAGEISPLELVEASLERIEAVDASVNALPTVCADRARAHASRIMEHGRPGGAGVWLGGLPIAVKDMVSVEGVRTTRGSRIFENNVPSRSDVVVTTLESRGAIVVAKSNTPEFGAGANTFNDVFGKTRNPWDTTKSCGGSSGGSAVALATGQVWLATGSDFGGSLRNPSSFCSVVGFRSSPGRIARGPRTHIYGSLSIEGPMARNVADVALMFDAQVGHHPVDPLSMPGPDAPFSRALEAPAAPRRVGFSPDLGIVPVSSEVRSICAAGAKRFETLGTVVDEACPDLHDAAGIFQVLRAEQFTTNFSHYLEAYPDLLKPEIVSNIEEGKRLSVERIAVAERARSKLYRRVVEWFETYDLLLCPATVVPPFDIEHRYVSEVEGQVLANYYDWMGICSAITITALPAISVPCGFTAGGLPVGLQIVGKPRGEAALLAAAYLFEQASGLSELTPRDPA